MESLKADLMITKGTQQQQKYEHDLMLVFWLAIHIENLEIARILVKREPIIKNLVAYIQLKDNQQHGESGIMEPPSRIKGGPINTSGKQSSQNMSSSSTRKKRPQPKRNIDYDEEVESSHQFSGEELEYEESQSDTDSSEEQDDIAEVQGRRQLYYEGGDEESVERQDNNRFKGVQQTNASQFKTNSAAQSRLLAPIKKPVPIKKLSNQSIVSSSRHENQTNNSHRSRPRLSLLNNNARGSGSILFPQFQQNSHRSNLLKETSPHNGSNYENPMMEKKKTLSQVLNEFKQKKNDNQSLSVYFQKMGLTEEQISKIDIKNSEDLHRIKHYMQVDSLTVMTQILKYALKQGEAKLSWIIIVEYEIILDEELLFNAVMNQNFQWLFFVWATRKNFLGNRNDQYASFITYEQLFDIIIRIYGGNSIETTLMNSNNKVEAIIKRILDWKITSDDKINNNIIRCLLYHHLDVIAVDYMGLYNSLLNKDLLIFCIKHDNNYFLSNALLLAAFDKMLFRDEEVINEILTILKRGYCTNFILNIISLIDISVWKNKRLTSLIEIINDYVLDDYNKNRLLLSPNPLMSIALACEILSKIATSRRKFESECYQIQQNMLKLGQMYSKKIEDEGYYENIIMSKDFNDRNIVKIITQNNFEPLMDEKDPKAERVMMMIWQGKEAAHCDGDIFSYSNLIHIIMSKPKKVMERNGTSFMQIVTNFFQPNLQLNYDFQYRFRTQSIQFYFYKELLCALLMLVIFQYINYRYLILFSSKTIKEAYTTYVNQTNITNSSGTFTIETKLLPVITYLTEAQQLDAVISSINEYVDWNFWALFFSSALIFQHILKVCFNMCSNLRIRADKWTIMDSISACLNIVAVILIQRIDPAVFLQPKTKDLVDYFMLLVLCVSWLRFFSYFLVVRSISKLLLTLIEMIGDTMSFLFLVSCFILIMSSIFATLYQDTNPEKYGGLAKTVTTLFNGVVAQYSYDDIQMEGRVISHTVLTVFHVFFTNILLMNYLIAILSSTYGKMRESGIFSFKVNLYQYCERYLTAFKDRAYGELVMHPPPLSFLSGLLLFCGFNRELMTKASKAMSYMMYWIENVVYVIMFIVAEIFMFPFAYIKIWYNLFQLRNVNIGTTSCIKTMMYCALWPILGLIIVSYILLLDLRTFMIILAQHDGFTLTQEQRIADSTVDDHLKVSIYNEVRAIVISLFLKIVKNLEKEGQQMFNQQLSQNHTKKVLEESSDDDDLDRIPDFFIIENYMMANGITLVHEEQQCFVVKKSLIIDELKKRRSIQQRRQRAKQVDFSSSNDALNKMVKDKLRKSLYRSMKQNVDETTQLKNRRQSMYHSPWDKPNNQAPNKKQHKLLRDLTSNLKGALLDEISKKIKEEEIDGNDHSDYIVPDDEIRLVEEFLTRFVIMPESGQRDQIDIKLMIKALPNKIMNYSLETIEMFNFRIFQESLHAYQNLDFVKAFEYFDEKNKHRVQVVKSKLTTQRDAIDDACSLLEIVKETLDNQSFSLNTSATGIKRQQTAQQQLGRANTNVSDNPIEALLNRMNSVKPTAQAHKKMLSNTKKNSSKIIDLNNGNYAQRANNMWANLQQNNQ